jgi:cytochrome c-type biogenesis protein
VSGIGATFAGLVSDGSLLVGILVAAVAGLISFASPCVLPLIPGYLGYIAGLTGAAAQGGPTGAAAGSVQTPLAAGRPGAGPSRHPLTSTRPVRTGTPAAPPRVLLGSVLFVLGFTAVFVSFGAAFGGLGRLLLEWSPVLTKVMGAITVIMGLSFLGVLPWLQRQRRITALPRAGLAGAPVLGIVFGLGWTPCIGPTLAAVSTLAYNQASATRGAVLALAYCLGLGVPFLAVALGLKNALRMSAWARRRAPAVKRAGGVLLVGLGILLLTGAWDQVMIWMRAWLATTGLGTSSI